MTQQIHPDTLAEINGPDLARAVTVTLGAASACWENLRGAGVFDSTRALALSEALIARIDAEIDRRVDEALAEAQVPDETRALLGLGPAVSADTIAAARRFGHRDPAKPTHLSDLIRGDAP